MPPKAYVVPLVWGALNGIQLISVGVWLANDAAGAVAMAVQAALREKPDLPPLIGVTATELSIEAVQNLLGMMQAGGPVSAPLQIMKPEGRA